MGSMKELMFEMEEERANQWIEENFPDVEEDTPEWDMAAQEYSWMLDALAEEAEFKWFQDSLHDLADRYRHAVRELDELKALVASAQAGIVFRMAYVHTVTVMEAFLMYSARALLNDAEHLDRFYSLIAPTFKKKINQCRAGILINSEKPTETCPIDEVVQKRRTAQLFVSQQTFHNLDHLKEYFSTMLVSQFEWPLESLRGVVNIRQDLVHRNGVSLHDEPVNIGSHDLENAIVAVRTFVDAVALTLLHETGAGDTLPVVHPRWSF